MTKCPTCGSPDAYVGFSWVECPNRECEHFSQKQADAVRPKPDTVPTEPGFSLGDYYDDWQDLFPLFNTRP